MKIIVIIYNLKKLSIDFNIDFFFIHKKKLGKKLGIIFGVFLVSHHEHS